MKTITVEELAKKLKEGWIAIARDAIEALATKEEPPLTQSQRERIRSEITESVKNSYGSPRMERKILEILDETPSPSVAQTAALKAEPQKDLLTAKERKLMESIPTLWNVDVDKNIPVILWKALNRLAPHPDKTPRGVVEIEGEINTLLNSNHDDRIWVLETLRQLHRELADVKKLKCRGE